MRTREGTIRKPGSGTPAGPLPAGRSSQAGLLLAGRSRHALGRPRP
ncbi:hypothetical protein [Rugosimonospora acidiphila]